MSASQDVVAHERFLDRPGGRLFVREVGHGPPVVVLHGGPDFDHEYLLPELDVLASDARLVYYDQRGRGRSFSGEGGGDVTLEGEMADLDAVRESVGAGPVALLGHSFGALLAAEFAIRRPERVTHLILLNPAPVSHAGVRALRDALAARRTPLETLRRRELAVDPAFIRGDLEPEAESYRIHFRSTVRSPEVLEAIVGRLRRAFEPAGIVAAREIETALHDQTWNRDDYDLTPALARLAIPTLVLTGDNDFIPPEVGRAIASALPDARFALLEDCGHFAYLEQPDAVRSLIADLLGLPAADHSL